MMKLPKLLVSLLLTLLVIFSCKKDDAEFTSTQAIVSGSQSQSSTGKQVQALASSVIEDFESGTKTSYTAGNVTLATGAWNFNDALIGNLSTDRKNGTQSARVRNSGIVSSNFDYTGGASTVSVMHAIFGTDGNGTWQLWYSVNGGSTYVQAGSTITTNSTTLQQASFTINVSGNIRFQLRKTDGGTNRINFDDFTVSPYTVANPPTLTSISPNSATAGGPSFTLTATGTNFTSASTVNWNGTALATTFVSATLLTATVPAADIATAGTANITVSTSGVGTSGALTFTINNNPPPILNTISPSTITAGSPAFTLTATGNSFISSSVIKWNGAALATTFVSSTSLTATVPATNIATAGTASVTVFSPTPGGGTSGAATFTITVASTVKKFLFDATHAETAGNADWVIDEDNSVPQRIPTPAQSTITSSTAETYWTGALSSFGISLVKKGNSVETLPSGSGITYGNSSNPQDLSHYDVFVVDEPNTVFTSAEKTAILNFVSNGGGLFMVSDHTQSDRNNDGWDSPAIWNDLMGNNTVQTNPFGFTIDLANFSQTTSNVNSNPSSTPILSGSQGNVTQMQFNNGTSATMNPAVNPNVKGLIWKTGVTQNNSNVMSLSSTFGNGRVFFVGDSSPLDDGTGASGNNLFVSWPLYSHTQLFMNASLWLAKLQ